MARNTSSTAGAAGNFREMLRPSIIPVAVAALVLSSGCYWHHGVEPGEGDAGAPIRMDAGSDAGRPWMGMDSGRPVDAAFDGAPPDAGRTDAGRTDAGRTDAGRTDAGPADAGRADAGPDAAGGGDASPEPDATVSRDGGACDPGADAGFAYSPHTIDWSDMRQSPRWPYYPPMGLSVMPIHAEHYLSDGSSWRSGAGRTRHGVARVARVERVGTSLRYHMTTDPRLLERTDYNAGEHTAHFALDAVADLVLVAEAGGTVGVIEGEVRIALDGVDYSLARFHPLSAPVCSIVPFVATFTLRSPTTFTETVFDRAFEYDSQVVVDFRSPRF